MGWVNAVAWSPSGKTLCYCGHDSSFHVVNFDSGTPVIQSIRYNVLPCISVLYTSENCILAAGYDFNPLVFQSSAGTWKYDRMLEVKKEAVATSSNSSVSAARALFQNKASRGQDAGAKTDTLWTSHTNTITGMQNMSAGDGNVTAISSSSLDGSIVVWDLVSNAFGSLNI